MRVLFLTRSLPIHGGVAQWLTDLAHGLDAVGFECIVALSKGTQFHRPERFRQAHPGLDYMELDGTAGTGRARQDAVRAAIAKVEPDIVIPVILADGLIGAVTSAKRKSYHLIYTVHEIADWIWRDLERFQEGLDEVVFVDRYTHAQYSALTRHASVIYAGVPAADLPPSRLPPPRPLPPGTLRIGYCGVLRQEQKRAMDIVELALALRRAGQPFDLRVAGDGLLRAAIDKAVSRHGLTDVVRIDGFADRSALYADFYRERDVLLVPSDWETGPLVAFEAMMNGCVVVTSDFLGRRESEHLVEERTCLTYPIGDMEAAARLMERLAKDGALRQRLQTGGYAMARAERSIEKMTAAWATLIHEVQKRAPRPVLAGPAAKDEPVGRLEAIGVPPVAARWMRNLVGRSGPASSPTREWPFHGV